MVFFLIIFSLSGLSAAVSAEPRLIAGARNPAGSKEAAVVQETKTDMQVQHGSNIKHWADGHRTDQCAALRGPERLPRFTALHTPGLAYANECSAHHYEGGFVAL